MTPIERDGLNLELIRQPARKGVARGKASGFPRNRLMDHGLLLGVGASGLSVWCVDRMVSSAVHVWPTHRSGGMDPQKDREIVSNCRLPTPLGWCVSALLLQADIARVGASSDFRFREVM